MSTYPSPTLMISELQRHINYTLTAFPQHICVLWQEAHGIKMAIGNEELILFL